jgi:hypothetical protein
MFWRIDNYFPYTYFGKVSQGAAVDSRRASQDYVVPASGIVLPIDWAVQPPPDLYGRNMRLSGSVYAGRFKVVGWHIFP